MPDRPLLVVDTATRTPVVALASKAGTILAERRWESRHRHGERLLEELETVLRETGIAKRDLGGVIVGTGPGSFTGLRIGLATAKVITYSLDVPLIGVSTTLALALASGAPEAAVTLPAGAVDLYVHLISRAPGTAAAVRERESPRLVAGADAFAEAVGSATVVAVDIDTGDVPDEPGRTALNGLPTALAQLGSADLLAGRTADPAELIPAYVALPRGLARAAQDMEWSPDLR